MGTPGNRGDGTTPDADGPDLIGGGVSGPVRRAPFADNPTVGARGLRTQQRILDAALRVFGENGYDRSTLEEIGQLAGCSRVSIYQYFSGKDDMFRHLAGQVARQLRASMEALDPLTPDEAGWASLRAWVGRYADIFARFEPVFRAFAAAAEADAVLVGGAVSTAERNIAVFQSRLSTPPLPPRQLSPMVALLLGGVTRALDIGSILRAALPTVYTARRVEDAIADVLHRVLFGPRPGVNARPPGVDRAPPLRFGQALEALVDRVNALQVESAQPDRRALASLLDVGDDVVVRRGYQGSRVDDIVEAAGVSRGAFYRYFDNRDDFVRVVAVRAVNDLSIALAQLPDPADRAALRRWLRRYGTVQAEKGAMIRVWTEAIEDELRSEHAAVYDWGRRRVSRLLERRGFGDVDADGIVLLAVIEAFGSMPREPVEVDVAVRIVERGLLGRDG